MGPEKAGTQRGGGSKEWGRRGGGPKWWASEGWGGPKGGGSPKLRVFPSSATIVFLSFPLFGSSNCERVSRPNSTQSARVGFSGQRKLRGEKKIEILGRSGGGKSSGGGSEEGGANTHTPTNHTHTEHTNSKHKQNTHTQNVGLNMLITQVDKKCSKS